MCCKQLWSVWSKSDNSQIKSQHSHLLWSTLQFRLYYWEVKETLKVINKVFWGTALVGSSLLCLSPALGEVNGNISRPLSGLPLILSLAVLAPKIVCFYTSLWLKSVSVRWPPPSAPPGSEASPLTPTRQTALPWDTPGGQLAAIGVFDQNYFFHKQSNWLKCFIWFTNH